MQTKRNQAGFTLIELLVVIAIIGILAAVGIPAYQGFQAKARFNASVENHARAKSYIAAEVTKCNGQTTSLAFTTKAGAAYGTPLTCPVPDAATAATYFQAYVADQMSNPYAPSMAATSAPASGNGLMTVGSDANGNVTLTTVAGPDQGVSTNAVKTLTDTIAVSD